ncbi:HET-domain-containing protein [Hypoxylon argillaceum]|nr:HET-domain-containing protein [Hypoxylon argillaceum]
MLLGQRLGLLGNGFLIATVTLFFDWIMPSWAKTTYVVFDHMYRANRSDANLVASKSSWRLRLGMFSAWLGMCMAYLIWAPNRRLIMIYHGVTQKGANLLIWSLIVLRNDGPIDSTNRVQSAFLDGAVSFLISSYCLTHRPWVWGLLKWSFIRLGVPFLCIGAGVYYFRRVLPLARAWNASLRRVVLFYNNAWDAFDYVEAQFVERFPRYIQHKWSSYQQSRPRRARLPTYQYRPLNAGEIRLLVLKESPFYPSVIHAELVHLPIYPPPDYEAVSYRWGSSDLTEEILIDGCRFRVTKAAFNLLLARRSVWRDRTVWIDAICINQEDLQEKSEQVQLMRDIYHRASRVISYPGSDWRYRIAGSFVYQLWALSHQYNTEDMNWLGTTDLARSPQWRAISDLFNDEYFTRAWVIQEIAVGQKTELYVGGMYIPWILFAKVSDWCFNPNRRHMLTASDEKEKRIWRKSHTFENIVVMTSLRPETEQLTGDIGSYSDFLDLENLLYLTSTFRSGDPRDRVFGLVGIARSVGDATLTTPDYSLPVEQVFQNTTRAIFSLPRERRTIHILALAGTGFTEHPRSMPSWVPNFSEERTCYPYSDIVKQDTCFKASGELSQDLKLEDETNSLIVKAMIIDQVKDLSEVGMLDWGLHHLELTDVFKIVRIMHRFVHGAIDLYRKHNMSPGEAEELSYERVGMALIAGRIDRKPAAIKTKQVFRYWLPHLDLLARARDRAHFTQLVKDGALDDTIDTAVDGTDNAYQLSILEGCFGRRVAITASGRLCVVPPFTKVGDSVIIPLGSQTPFLIRQHDSQSENVSYELIGEAWVEGVMHGEMIGSTDEEFIRLS